MSDIIYADDDAAMRAMVSEVLRAGGYDARAVSSGGEALEAVRDRPPELVILDYRMGRPDGFEVCQRLKDDPRTAHIPVLILTAKDATEFRLKGFDAGADDYLAKPFDARELLARVRALLRLTRQGLDRNPTSTLPGGDAIYREYARRRATGEPFALSYFDLDNFKSFGDRFGFSTADALIRETALALAASATGGAEFLGHVGGDDFLLMSSRERARHVVEEAQGRLLESLGSHVPPEVLAAGVYRGVDRDGREREIPLTRLTAAILYLDPAEHPSLNELGAVIARAKNDAKLESSGILEIEIRGDPASAQPPATRGGPPPSDGPGNSRNS